MGGQRAADHTGMQGEARGEEVEEEEERAQVSNNKQKRS